MREDPTAARAPRGHAVGGGRLASAAAMAAALLAITVAGPGAGKAAEEGLGAGGLTGRLLVATAEMRDPRFVRTVIYMVGHGPAGAMGLVLNRPMGEVPLARLLEDLGLDPRGVTGSVRVHYGGPVDAARGVVLHTGDYAGKETLRINDSVAMTWQPDILRAIAAGTGPRRSLFVLGYAGWGPRQLEAEMDAGSWITVTPDEDLVFDDDYGGKWERAMARRPIRL